MGWFEEGRLVAFIIGSLWDQERLTTVGRPAPFQFITYLSKTNACIYVISTYDLFAPGRPDSPQALRLHRPHPRPRCPSHLQAAGQGPHSDVALPAISPLPAQRAPSSADVRRLPRSLLPQVRLQGSGALRHHRGQPDLHRDVVPHQRPRVHAAQQRSHPLPSASIDSAAGKD